MRSPTSLENQAMDQLHSQQARLLDRIDELRTIGVSGLVDLPQLIVCGNQSSGKSSVLEAISRVRFPAKSNVCTRFATEVILRRQSEARIKVSIEPGSSRTDPDKRKSLLSFRPAAFGDSNDLPSLIEEAKQHMGIDRPDSPNAGFSDDVLKVEISGPDKPELTLVDLPGLYYSTSQDQTLQGIKIVRGLTERYMQNPRSIIMAVISAKADYHLQEVLNMAERFDPKRERTIGIITQPDILEANSEEETNYLQFVRNEKIKLHLGWHVLRNRSFETQALDDDARDQREKEFFEQGRWASLSRENVGIDSLRRRLSHILLKHVARNLPDLISDIQSKITDRQQQLEKLGQARSTVQQQRGFLLAISSSFERITGQALNGMYADSFFGALDPEATLQLDFRRLRAVIRELNESFAEAMDIGGCRRLIHNWSEPADPRASKACSNPYLKDWKPDYVTREALEREMNDQARKNRGIELPGSANQLLVGSLFRDQSRPWESIARDHLMNSWEATKYFVCLVLRQLTDEHTYSMLVSSVLGPELENIKASLLDKLSELTAYHKRGHPLPVGKSFLSKIQESRVNRQLTALKQSLGAAPLLGEPKTTFSLNDVEQSLPRLQSSDDEFAAADIIDQMQAYYDTSVVTFVDNVATLAIENCLLDPLERIFTSQTVNNMDDEHISTLAAEQPHIRQDRARLTVELERLQSGIRSLNGFAIGDATQPILPTFAVRTPMPLQPKANLNTKNSPGAKDTANTVAPGSKESMTTVNARATLPTAGDTARPKGSSLFGGFGAMPNSSASNPASLFGNASKGPSSLFGSASSNHSALHSGPGQSTKSAASGTNSGIGTQSPFGGKSLFSSSKSPFDTAHIPSTKSSPR